MSEHIYYERRWDLAGNRLPGVPVTLAPGLSHKLFPAQNCGNLPECYGCDRVIQRHEQFHSVAARYVQPQPSGDVVRDYVHGGTFSAAYATLCESCWSARGHKV